MLPGTPGEDPLIGFPLVLPMGWMQPPFCHSSDRDSGRLGQRAAASEWSQHPASVGPTIGNGTSPRKGRAASILGRCNLGHPCSCHALRPPSGLPRATLKAWDVYVNYLIVMVQGNHRHRRRVKRVLLHALDRVFRKLDKEDGPHRQESALVKKMKKGNTTWATRKVILGWTTTLWP
jgi:hypothetical protein